MTKDEKARLTADLEKLEAAFIRRESRLEEIQSPQYIHAQQIVALKRFLVSLAQVILASK